MKRCGSGTFGRKSSRVQQEGRKPMLSLLQSEPAICTNQACLVGTMVRWTAVLEVMGSNPALVKQRIKFLGLLRLPAGVGL